MSDIENEILNLFRQLNDEQKDEFTALVQELTKANEKENPTAQG